MSRLSETVRWARLGEPGQSKAKVARAHRKARASRTDFLHRTCTALVRDHDVIVVEDLAVQNMVRNRSLARAISGSSRVQSAVKQEPSGVSPRIPA